MPVRKPRFHPPTLFVGPALVACAVVFLLPGGDPTSWWWGVRAYGALFLVGMGAAMIAVHALAARN